MSTLLYSPYRVNWSIKQEGMGFKMSQNLSMWFMEATKAKGGARALLFIDLKGAFHSASRQRGKQIQ